MTFREGLLWLMGAGAGIVAFYLLDRLERSATFSQPWQRLRNWFALLAPEDKRWVAFAVTGLLAIIAYLLTLLMAYNAPPGDWRAWVEELFAVVAAAIIASQVTHGRVALRRKELDLSET
jgi:hypothetical protein